MTATLIATIILAVLAGSIVRRRRSVAAAALPDEPLPNDEIAENIRVDVAPASRPYGDGGVLADERGRTYAVAVDGSIRRFAIAESETGDTEVVLVRKAGKAERKAAKRAHRADRGVQVRPVVPAARVADRASAARLANTLSH